MSSAAGVSEHGEMIQEEAWCSHGTADTNLSASVASSSLHTSTTNFDSTSRQSEA